MEAAGGMGYLRPTVLVVTGSYDRHPGEDGYVGPRRHWAEIAREQALEVLGQVSRREPDWHQVQQFPLTACVSELSPSLWNGTRSFAIFWDGSKEGWPPSDVMDVALERFVGWLREQAYGDGSGPLDWVWVRYGGDDRVAEVLAHGDQRSGVELDPADRFA